MNVARQVITKTIQIALLLTLASEALAHSPPRPNYLNVPSSTTQPNVSISWHDSGPWFHLDRVKQGVSGGTRVYTGQDANFVDILTEPGMYHYYVRACYYEWGHCSSWRPNTGLDAYNLTLWEPEISVVGQDLIVSLPEQPHDWINVKVTKEESIIAPRSHTWRSNVGGTSVTIPSFGVGGYYAEIYVCNSSGASCDGNVYPDSETVSAGIDDINLIGDASVSGTVSVSWNAVPNADSYWVYRYNDWGGLDDWVQTTSNYYIFGSVNPGEYTFAVKYCIGSFEYECSFISSYTETIFVDVIAAPSSIGFVDPSTGQSTNKGTGGSVQINWSSTDPAPERYELERQSPSSGDQNWYSEYSGQSTSYTDGGFESGEHFYRVRACTGTTCSLWTTSGRLAVAVAPTNIQASYQEGTGYNVSWSSSLGYVHGYILEKSIDGLSWEQIYSGSQTSSADPNVSSGTTHYYRVKSYFNVASSEWVTTMAQSPPSTPSFSSVQPVGTSGSVSISWTVSTGTVTSYEIQRSANGGGSYVAVEEYTSGTSVVDANLSEGNYLYRVRACSGPSCSSWSTSNSVTVVLIYPPTGLSAQYSSNPHGLEISWNSDPQASSYDVARSLNGTTWNESYYSGSSTSFIDEDIDDVGDTIYYRVRACSSVCSDWTSSPAQ